MADVEIFSARHCPFAQRSRIMLIEKGVDFSVTEIDLRNKPHWFTGISPYGKVPCIRHEGRIVYESAVINEYLEEAYPQPAFMPAEPYPRALVRIWVDFANTKYFEPMRKLREAGDTAARREALDRTRENFLFMEREALVRFGGPYWLGAEITLADIALYPFFERLPAAEHHFGVRLPEECAGIRAWITAMAERPGVKETALPADYHIERMGEMLKRQRAA